MEDGLRMLSAPMSISSDGEDKGGDSEEAVT